VHQLAVIAERVTESSTATVLQTKSATAVHEKVNAPPTSAAQSMLRNHSDLSGA